MELLAINGGNKTKTKEFPKWPYSDEREKELITEVCHSPPVSRIKHLSN